MHKVICPVRVAWGKYSKSFAVLFYILWEFLFLEIHGCVVSMGIVGK